MPPEDVFQTERSLLFSIAYRMLGSASEAEDVLQDAWMRFAGVDAGEVRSPKALATTIVTRLCLDRLKAARREAGARQPRLDIVQQGGSSHTGFG